MAAHSGYSFSFAFGNYWDVWVDNWPQFLRSFVYAAIATVLAIVIAYPLAYTIALKVSARVRPIMLVLVIAPFFTSFLIRTLAMLTTLPFDSDEAAISLANDSPYGLPLSAGPPISTGARSTTSPSTARASHGC